MSRALRIECNGVLFSPQREIKEVLYRERDYQRPLEIFSGLPQRYGAITHMQPPFCRDQWSLEP